MADGYIGRVEKWVYVPVLVQVLEWCGLLTESWNAETPLLHITVRLIQTISVNSCYIHECKDELG